MITIFSLAVAAAVYARSPHALSLEAGGIGGFYSANYEHTLAQKGSRTLGLRAGVSLSSSTILDFPLALTGMWMPGRNGLEIGTGITPELYVADGVTDGTVLLSGMLGYRRQVGAGPVFLRCYLSPTMDLASRKRFAWFGAGAGYSF
jgi:hypothetical protein